MIITAGSSRSFFIALIAVYVYCIGTWKTTAAMRLVVQRVKSASVTVDGSMVSSIGPGAM